MTKYGHKVDRLPYLSSAGINDTLSFNKYYLNSYVIHTYITLFALDIAFHANSIG